MEMETLAYKREIIYFGLTLYIAKQNYDGNWQGIPNASVSSCTTKPSMLTHHQFKI